MLVHAHIKADLITPWYTQHRRTRYLSAFCLSFCSTNNQEDLLFLERKMKTTLTLTLTITCLLSVGIPALAQQPWCWSFEALDGFSTGSYSYWKYSNKERAPFYVPPSDDGYIWTTYLTSKGAYKPQIITQITKKVTKDTTFALSYYLNKISNNLTLNFIRTSDNVKIRVGIVPTNSNVNNVTSWMTYSGNCQLCCEVDVNACSGQFEIIGTNILNSTDLALSTFTINNGSCETPLPTACYDFKSWGQWTNANNWNLKNGDKLLNKLVHPSLPPCERNYAWIDTTNPPTSNLTSPLINSVTMATKLSLEYYMTDSQSAIRVYFLRSNSVPPEAQKIDEFTGSVDNEWDHREIKCHLANGAFCCGNYSEKCDGYFMIETLSVSDGIIALDNVGVNDANCGKARPAPEYEIEDEVTIDKGPGSGKSRFNFFRKDKNSVVSFNYNF